jgi:cathepsin C
MGVWVVLLGLMLSSDVMGDTPANCTYDDIVGTWTFYETERSGDGNIDCSKQGKCCT